MQTYTSANTSVNKNKVPKVFRKVHWDIGEINLDYGGGKYDTASDFLMKEYGAYNLIYDPFNRTREHNNAVLADLYIHGGADTCTISNVLNVIDEKLDRLIALRMAKTLMKHGGLALITVYEGDKSGVGRRTGKDQWQNNLPLRAYLEEVREVFEEAHISRGMIVATRE